MANLEHINKLSLGANDWNVWRRANRLIKEPLDLSGAYLAGWNLYGANLSGADFSGSNLNSANLFAADLGHANLSRASLVGADLSHAIFHDTNLSESDLSQSKLLHTTFGDVDLSVTRGLDLILHIGPSTIGIDTIYRSKGLIPKSFLRDAGMPEEFVTYVDSLIGKAYEFYSCFISYSHKDADFAKHLFYKMRDKALRVWFAPEHIKGGQKLHEQIDRAIQLHDRLLLVLSDHSMQSEWVMTEIRDARRIEIVEKRRKLFPIRLVDIDSIKKWTCFDADEGKIWQSRFESILFQISQIGRIQHPLMKHLNDCN